MTVDRDAAQTIPKGRPNAWRKELDEIEGRDKGGGHCPAAHEGR